MRPGLVSDRVWERGKESKRILQGLSGEPQSKCGGGSGQEGNMTVAKQPLGNAALGALFA